MNKFGQNLHKFVAKLLTVTGYCLKDILTFLGLDKSFVKNVKNHPVFNGRTNILVAIIELLRHAKFEMDRTILTCL